MAGGEAFYELGTTEGAVTAVVPTRHTAGPWSPDAQHGGPPAALLARAVDAVGDGTRTVSRITVDLLGPVPLAPLGVRAAVTRPGRSVELLGAELADDAGRVVMRASAWRVPRGVGGAVAGLPEPPPGPDHGRELELPPGWHRGYLDTITWRWVEGSLAEPGPATVWMRPGVPLAAGEELTPLQRLLVCVDSASGVSSARDIRQWQFMNTELTVHLVRELRGEWVGLRARTVLGGGASGLALAEVFDEEGFVGHSAQALLVRPVAGHAAPTRA
jgi:acyl-coenzyme A thioesterase PaaI-like protein